MGLVRVNVCFISSCRILSHGHELAMIKLNVIYSKISQISFFDCIKLNYISLSSIYEALCFKKSYMGWTEQETEYYVNYPEIWFSVSALYLRK